MSRKKYASGSVSRSPSTRATSEVNSAPQLTQKQQAAGLALAGGALATPLLLALLDKALSLEEIQSICYRAREIASHFDDLPEGKFALACLDDFLLPRTSSRMREATDSSSPAMSEATDSETSEGTGSSSSSPAIVPSEMPEGARPSYEADAPARDS